MKLKIKNSKRYQGFTLVEILVVITIIATLAGISIPIGLRVYNSAKDAETTALAKELEVATLSYYQDFSSFPGTVTEGNTTTMIDFVKGLVGENERSRVYLKMADASGDPGAELSGIVRDSSGEVLKIVDGFGSELVLAVDEDLDNEITLGASFGDYDSDIVRQKMIVIASGGRDRALNKDQDVLTW